MNIPKEVIATINVLLQPYGTSLEALTAAKPEKAEKVEKYYTLRQAAEKSGFTPRYLRREFKAGRLKAVKGSGIHSRIRVPDTALEEWMNSRR